MSVDLDRFLVRHMPMVSEHVAWGERMRLRATAYLTRVVPPQRYVTSVRAVVLRDESVLVQQDHDSRHVLPGGRREGNESLEATLRREVGEETGWSLGEAGPLGFIHFRHLDPVPPDYAYSYPDFCQLVFMAEATVHSADARLDDGYEIGSEFVSIPEARHLSLTRIERTFLDAALEIATSGT